MLRFVVSMENLNKIHKKLAACDLCPGMCGKPVHGQATKTQIMLIGQAPGPHEARLGRPFAYTAGKTLFSWLNRVSNLSEDELRHKIYFAAVARCFPGKNSHGGGDREPSAEEIKNCRVYLEAEVSVIKPKLIIAVGKLAIAEVLGPNIFRKNAPLTEVIGKKFYVNYFGHSTYVVPLPHPSGISTWHKKSPGKELLADALALIPVTDLR